MHAIPIERNTFNSHQRAWQEPGGTSWKGTEYRLHLIKIPSHVRVESSYYNN